MAPSADGLSEFCGRLEAIALGINTQFPHALGLAEVRAIAKSVAKWTWARFTPEKFTTIQRRRAQARTRRNLLQSLRRSKMPAHDPTRRTISAAALAARLGTSVSTARRVWAEPRALYEARSLARQQPWKLEGISRSTWYARRAKARGSS